MYLINLRHPQIIEHNYWLFSKTACHITLLRDASHDSCLLVAQHLDISRCCDVVMLLWRFVSVFECCVRHDSWHWQHCWLFLLTGNKRTQSIANGQTPLYTNMLYAIIVMQHYPRTCCTTKYVTNEHVEHAVQFAGRQSLCTTNSFVVQHSHFPPYRISLRQAESLPKCPLTLEIAQSTPSFTPCSQLN